MAKSLGGLGVDRPAEIQKTKDGGCVVIGYVGGIGGDVTNYHGDTDVWVVKLDVNGNVQWERAYGGSLIDEGYHIAQTYDGGYIFTGITSSNDGDVIVNTNPFSVGWVVKLDSIGNIQSQRISFSDINIKPTKDSGSVEATSVHSSIYPLGSPNDSDTFNLDYSITKYNKDGIIDWQKTYGGSGNDNAYLVQQTFDKGYIVCGTSNSNDGDVDSNFFGISATWVIKLDSVGNLQWKHFIDYYASYDGSVSENDFKQAPDSSYILSAFEVGDYDCDEDGCTPETVGDMLTKIDKHGKIIWKKFFPNYDYYVMPVKDGYIVGGDKYDTSFTTILWQENVGEYYADCYSNEACVEAGTREINNTLDFYVLSLQSNVILPVKLLSFIAQKQNSTTLLQWQTANEINNDYFSIERSADSKLFTSIGNKHATNNALRSNYSFVDNAPLAGVNYYRLKQVDKDGKFTYSNILSVDFSSNAATFAVYPNPAGSSLNITLPLSDKTSDVVLYDVNGKKVMHEQLQSNITSKQLNIGSLPAGVYNVVLMQDGKQQTLKVIKK